MTTHQLIKPYLSRRIYVKSVGSFVPKLAQKAFEKYGFSRVTLLTDWAIIAGSELSNYTQPERLKWPRKVTASTQIEVSDKGRPGATLILRVDPARALEVQYATAQLIERINGYFGYNAVDGIKILQAPIQNGRNISAPISKEATLPTTYKPTKRSNPRSDYNSDARNGVQKRLNSVKNAGQRPSDDGLVKALDRLQATFHTTRGSSDAS